MADKKKQKNNTAAFSVNTPKNAEQKQPETGKINFKKAISGFRLQALIITIITLAFYCNTFSNEFALDDVIVIQQNDYVHQGFSGIPAIVSNDNQAAYYKHLNADNQYTGGRYRPLSVVTFAIEEELLGKDNDENPALGQPISENALRYMHTRHMVNVLFYLLSVIAFLYFLRSAVFKNNPLLAFTAALLFTIHPIHTEVVANIKSRDEILSFLFICLTLIYANKYRENHKLSTIAIALVCFALALFSKEYAMILVVLVPLMFYLFKADNLGNSIKATIPYIILLAAYLAVRFSIVSPKVNVADTDVQNNPYLYANGLQKIATEIATLLNYLKLLLWPHPLAADYAYKQIPYSDLSSPKFRLSLLVHIGLIVACIQAFLKRSPLCFAIAFYLLNLAIVSNLFFNLGTTMGERLIYHASAGFAIALACLFGWALKKINSPQRAFPAFASVLVVLVLACGYKVVARNADWKNTNTLFMKDVQTVPNSFLANGIAGVAYCSTSGTPENKDQKAELLQKGIAYLSKAISINKDYVNGYYNRALAYNVLREWDKELPDLDSVKKRNPNYPALAEQYLYLYQDKGMARLKEHKNDEAIAAYKEACKLSPNDPEMWYMLGISYYSAENYKAAIVSWEATLKLNPNHNAAKTAMTAAQKKGAGVQ